MAQGSEKISVRWIGNAKRECIKCGVKITNLDKQVGETRTRYPGRVTEITCRNCQPGAICNLCGRTRRAHELDKACQSPEYDYDSRPKAS